MFAGKARSLPYSGAPEKFFTLVGSGFTRKHYTRLKKLAGDKHCGLLHILVNYGRKKFYRIGSRIIKKKE
jgi:hypothetical protein